MCEYTEDSRLMNSVDTCEADCMAPGIKDTQVYSFPIFFIQIKAF